MTVIRDNCHTFHYFSMFTTSCTTCPHVLPAGITYPIILLTLEYYLPSGATYPKVLQAVIKRRPICVWESDKDIRDKESELIKGNIIYIYNLFIRKFEEVLLR